MPVDMQAPLPRLKAGNRQPRFVTLRTITALILREMTTTYGRSPGGYLWVILEPVLGIAVMATIFSIFLRTPPLGTNFTLFYATGMLPFTMFTSLSSKVASALGYSRNLLAYPRVTILDAILARIILCMLTELLVAYLILSSVMLIFDTNASLDMPRILLSFAMATALGGGFGLLNCFLFNRFIVWKSVWGIITRPLMIASGVIFLYDMIPEPWRGYLWFNPLVHVTGEMRGAFYLTYHGDYVTPAYVFGLSLIVGIIGLLFLWRYHRDFLDD